MRLPLRSGRQKVWLDPRFVIGTVLVAASVAGVVLVVAAFDRSNPVYVASGPLSVGQRVDASDLDEVSVNLGSAGGGYLDPASMPEGGLVITRTIADGELIPLTAVGDAAADDLATVVVELSGRVGADVVAGARVDLWVAAPAPDGGYKSPSVLVSGASVIQLVAQEGLMASNTGTGVELQLPTDSVAAVLEAIADESSLALVAVNVGLGR